MKTFIWSVILVVGASATSLGSSGQPAMNGEPTKIDSITRVEKVSMTIRPDLPYRQIDTSQIPQNAKKDFLGKKFDNGKMKESPRQFRVIERPAARVLDAKPHELNTNEGLPERDDADETILEEGFEADWPVGLWEVSGDPTWDDDNLKHRNGRWAAWCANGGESGYDPSGVERDAQGFEGAFPYHRWVVRGDPTWDDDDYQHRTGNWAAWCANGGDNGIDPDGPDGTHRNYPPNMDAWMIYGPFDLSIANSGGVDFWRKYSIANDDWGKYGLGTSDDEDQLLGYRFSGLGWLFGWHQPAEQYRIIFSAFADEEWFGNDKVWLAFGFESNNDDNSGNGFWVDDINITISPGHLYYQNNMNAWMKYGPIDLSNATSASCQFYEIFYTERDFDECSYGLSTDDRNYDLYSRSGENWGDFDATSIDFSDFRGRNYLGEGQVWVGWNFTSDESVVDYGWWIDDVRIEREVLTIPNPPSDVRARHNPSDRSQHYLTWVDNSDNEDGFIIEEQRDNDGWREIGRVGRNETEYRTGR